MDVFVRDLSVSCQFDLRTVGDAGPYGFVFVCERTVEDAGPYNM